MSKNAKISLTEEITMSDTHKLNCSKIQKGDVMAFFYYVKVKEVNTPCEELIVTALDGTHSDIKITGKDLIEASYSADQVLEEQKVTKTQAAEILTHSSNKPFTVSFLKQDGSERVLKGRLIKSEPLLGRSMVEDLEEIGVNRLRQVDHRTINWLIVDCVKYVVK